MRSRMLGATTADTFHTTLLQIGNGSCPKIKILSDFPYLCKFKFTRGNEFVSE
ncbi:Hypothetical protein FKW44_000635 [Caligus rogercresseyi]|uniref:Uncharacterized protein n=1 Tax=Caligus rogercresseyi TaxID=217165 RepID=A0A7T8KHU0_CALRO|nr:Hypothetical protein FKW44_000635 [Caligus rogercresseyi]